MDIKQYAWGVNLDLCLQDARCKKPCIFYFLHGGNNLDSKYIIEVSNSTETKEDIRFGYVKATKINKETGETIYFRFCEPIQKVTEYVTKFAENLMLTKELEGRLLRIGLYAIKE